MPSLLRRSLIVSVLAAGIGATCLAETTAPVLRAAGGSQPQLTVASDGAVWLVYGETAPAPAPASHDSGDKKGKGGHGHGAANRPDGAVFVARSDDGGVTFAHPVKVATVPKLMLGRRRGPRIAAHGDRVTVTVVAHELLAFTSHDRGKTWAGPVTVNDVPTSAREGLHDLAGAPDGGLFVTWLDMRNGKMELWGASSRDGGRTWAANEQVYRSPGKSICECCHPSALFDAQGNLAVMWRNSIEGTRDMWMTTRPKGQRAFTTARKLGEGTWKLEACPMDGGRIVAFGDGRFGAVWQRAGEVYFVPADGAREILVGKGTQPVAVVHDGKATVFWQQGADLMILRAPGEGTAEKRTARASFASVVFRPQGRGGLLAYEQAGTGGKPASVVVEPL